MDDLHYGNLNRESLSFLREDNVFTRQFDKWKGTPYPDVDTSYKEIENLIKIQDKAINNPRWEQIKKFNELCDESIQGTDKDGGIDYEAKIIL